MAISAGSYTVGTIGADYATWAAALLDVSSPLTGNLTLTQIDDTSESANGTLVISLAGYDFLMTNASPHGGVIGVGNIIEGSGTGQINLILSGNGSFEAEHLQFKKVSGGTVNACVIQGQNILDANGYSVHDILMDNNSQFSYGRFQLYFPNAGTGEAYNIFQYGYIGNNGSLFSAPLRFDCVGYDDISIRNCISYSASAGNPAMNFGDVSGSNVEVVNCIAVNTAAGIAFYQYGTGTLASIMSNCASDDATAVGTDPIINFVPATEFESIVSTDPNFLVPASGSQFKEAGVAVSQTIDMHGNAYGASPPIGAYIAAVAVSNNVIVFQASRLDQLKSDFDLWMAANGNDKIFTAVYLNIEVATRTVGRLMTLVAFYNGGGGTLTDPFVLNYADGASLDDVNAEYEAFVAANPVAGTFYGSMFVDRTEIARKAANYSYVWVTNEDQAAAPINWSAENAIT